MNTYYYLTPTKNVPGILRKGLQAGRGKGLSEFLYEHPSSGELMKEEKSRGLYFTDDLESMGELIGIMSNLVKKSKSFTILEVSLPDNYRVEPDERRFGGGAGALGGFLRSNVTKIPASMVKVIGSVVVRPKHGFTYNLNPATEEVVKLGMKSSELAGYINPELVVDEEDLEVIERDIRKLPKSSRAHNILEGRLERMDYWKRLSQELETREPK